MCEKNKSGITAVGISSLLAIFAVLCLVVFTLLTVSTVRANQTLSNKAVSATLGYYRADMAAEKTLASLRTGIVPNGVQKEGNIFYYNHPISDTQTLVVEVMVDGSNYYVLRWQAVSVAEWYAEDWLPVWNGETEEGST